MPQPHPDAAVEAGAALLAMLPKLRMYNHFKQIATSDEEKTHRNTLYYRKNAIRIVKNSVINIF